MLDSSVKSTSSPLSSFGSDINVAVIGASGGLGRALVQQLSQTEKVAHVISLSRQSGDDTMESSASLYLDLESEESIEVAARRIEGDFKSLDLVIVATGILHQGAQIQPERTWRSLDAKALDRVLRVNAIGPAMVAKHFLPLLSTRNKSVFAAISARVGSIEDNYLGGWHSYRASKAALNMLIRTFSVELARKNPSAVCAALHPGTVDTSLSKPFQRNVAKDKLKAPSDSAQHLIKVIDALTPDDSGGLFAWDGQRIPF